MHLLGSVTQKILDDCNLGTEIRNIRKEWIKRGIAKGDKGHNTRQYMHNNKPKRLDCIIIKNGIQRPQASIPPAPVTSLPPTPVSDYAVDDAQAINEIFGGENE